MMLILCIDCGFVAMIFINKDGSSRYLYYLFSYGLAIANTLLGLSVFVFHCVRREDVHHCWKSFILRRRQKFIVNEEINENEALLEQTDYPMRLSALKANPRLSAVHSEHNHSDIVSGISVAPSVFTHDIPSSRPSSIFGQSCAPGDANDISRPQGPGRLTLPTFDNKPSPKQNDLPSAEPTAPPLPPGCNPLAGFAAYPPSTVPETVTMLTEQPVVATESITATPDFTITTVSERTFSDHSNMVPDGRPLYRQPDATREHVTSDCSTAPSHIDRNKAPPLQLRSFVAPNWKPVRRGGSSAVFYPYVDPGFKLLQGPKQSSSNSVVGPAASTAQDNFQGAAPTESGNPMVPLGAFTIPQRTEVIGGSNSNKTASVGNQTDHDHPVKVPSEAEVKEKKVEQVRKHRTPSRRRRAKSRTRFDDLPVEKCVVYVPIPRASPKKTEIRTETSV